MEIILKIETPQKGIRFVERIGGKIVTFQIVDVAEEAGGSGQSTGCLQELESAQEKLKGTVLKYDRPFDPAVPESDWEVYRP